MDNNNSSVVVAKRSTPLSPFITPRADTCNLNSTLDTMDKLTAFLRGHQNLHGDDLHIAMKLASAAGESGEELLAQALRSCAYEGCTGTAAALPEEKCDPKGGGHVKPEPKCEPDIRSGRRPRVEAFQGTFVDPMTRQRSCDPLVFRVSDVETTNVTGPGGLYFINRTAHFAADRFDKTKWVKIPWDGKVDFDGHANIAIGDAGISALGLDKRNGGTLLEVFHVDEAGNPSPWNMVAINKNAPNQRVGNPLGAGPVTWVGIQQSEVKRDFLTVGDEVPAAVNTQALKQVYDAKKAVLTIMSKDGGMPIEPYAKVFLSRPVDPYDNGSCLPYPVLWDGTLRDGICDGFRAYKVSPHEAVVMHIFDHSTTPVRGAHPLTERLVVFSACRDNYVVVDNPALGHTGPIKVANGRIGVEVDVHGKASLVSEDRAATKGTIVTVANQTTGARYTTTFGPDGKCMLPLDAAVGDKIAARVDHAFPGMEGVDLGVLKVACGRVAFVGSQKPMVDKTIETAIRVRVLDCSLDFDKHYPNSGNSAKINADTDWQGTCNAVFQWDGGEVAVTVGNRDDGFRQEELSAKSITPYFGYTSTPAEYGYCGIGKDSTIESLRAVLAPLAAASKPVPVRFQRDDGTVIARGVMNTHDGRDGFGAVLDPASLKAV